MKGFRDEAIPFVSYDAGTRQYRLHEEAAELLAAVPAPLAIISVAGLYRTGKSYLLNKMILNRASGFGVGPTVNPHTKGLWIWGRPLLCKTSLEETVHTLVVDSEGIGACEEDATHDCKVFALTMLLSSMFIYNSVGAIDEQSIENLQLIINLSKTLRIKAGHTPQA
jgi:hypothetical protein